jgi:hypothetical protein
VEARIRAEHPTGAGLVLSQQLNPATKQLLGVGWNGCCENGDVFKTLFRVSKSTGGDEWYYLKGDTWKKVPDYVIHWGQHAPDKRATLFIYVATGQELCFYPPEEKKEFSRCGASSAAANSA